LSRPERESSSRRHRVNAIDARIRPFIFESQQRLRATSSRPRSLDERVRSFFFYRFVHPPHRRTRRDGLARDATTRRWMMNRIVAIARRPTARSMPMEIIIIAMME